MMADEIKKLKLDGDSTREQQIRTINALTGLILVLSEAQNSMLETMKHLTSVVCQSPPDAPRVSKKKTVP